MKRTDHYSLPQWEKSDRIMMDDFNDAMGRLDSGLTTAQLTADSAQTVANAARSAASSAQTAADAAQSTADTARKEASSLYAVGTYTGTGESHHIKVGFRPRAVIISGVKEAPFSTSDVGTFASHACITTGHTVYRNVVFTSTGFTVDEVDGCFPMVNIAGRVYDYIAFK